MKYKMQSALQALADRIEKATTDEQRHAIAKDVRLASDYIAGDAWVTGVKVLNEEPYGSKAIAPTLTVTLEPIDILED